MKLGWSSLLATTALAACLSATTTEPRPSPARSTAEAIRDMHARFDAAMSLEFAIGQNNLEWARRAGRTIAEMDVPDALRDWSAAVSALRSTSQLVADAPSIEEAAKAAGLIAERCADCHVATHAILRTPSSSQVMRDPASMVDHQKAAAEMWQGLFEPSDARWQDGASMLAVLPPDLAAEILTPSSDIDRDDVSVIRDLATRASAVADEDSRAALFTRLLERCAHCHAAIRR